MKGDEIVAAVGDVDLSGIRALVLFGSAAEDPAGARDIDIAVFPRPGSDLDSEAVRRDLQGKMSKPVHPVVMRPGFSVTLGFEIASRHRMLWEVSPGVFDEIWSLLLRMYFDGEKFRERRRRLIREAVGHVA